MAKKRTGKKHQEYMTQNKKDQAGKVAEGILVYLKNNHVEDLLPEVITRLKKAVNETTNQIVIESAIELSPSEKNVLIKSLQKKYGWKGEYIFRSDREILAGLKITYGDKIIDLSVSGKLKHLYESF